MYFLLRNNVSFSMLVYHRVVHEDIDPVFEVSTWRYVEYGDLKSHEISGDFVVFQFQANGFVDLIDQQRSALATNAILRILDPQFASVCCQTKGIAACVDVSPLCVCVCVRVLNANFQEIDEAKTPNLLVIFPSKKSPAKKCSQKSGNILDTIVPKCGFGPISMNSNHQGPHAFLLYLSAPFPKKALFHEGFRKW